MIGVVTSKNNVVIRLSAERWSHIVEAHDDMAGKQDLDFETIENPDFIRHGGKDELIAVKHYKKTSISEKNMVVVYKEETDKGFVITAFMTSKPDKIFKRGATWKK